VLPATPKDDKNTNPTIELIQCNHCGTVVGVLPSVELATIMTTVSELVNETKKMGKTVKEIHVKQLAEEINRPPSTS